MELHLLKWLRPKDKKAAWETIPVGLTTEASFFVDEILKKEGNPASYAGIATTLRLIDKAARVEFGPILTDQRINPLSPAALQHLIEKGALDLSASNILKTYEEHKKTQR